MPASAFTSVSEFLHSPESLLKIPKNLPNFQKMLNFSCEFFMWVNKPITIVINGVKVSQKMTHIP